jgi:hypothetical protein
MPAPAGDGHSAAARYNHSNKACRRFAATADKLRGFKIMSTEEGKDRKAPRREHGPQGTHVFSRDDVDRLLQEAEATSGPASSAQLQGASAEVKGRSFPLNGQRCVLGRAAECDIVLSDASVSSEHARLSLDGAGWRVVNLLSTNGTFVNDKRISNEALRHGDRLRLGRVEFIFQEPDRPAAGTPAGQPAADGRSWMPWLIVAAVAGAVVAGLVILL